MEKRTSVGVVVVAIAVAVATWLAAPVAGQNQGATLTGRVVLEDGSRLPGVTVTVGGRTTVTNENGEFRFLFLPPGSTKVRFELEGFKTVERTIDLEAGESAQLEVQLQTTPMMEEVIVAGKSPVVDVRATAFQRQRDDGSTSLGVGLDGVAFDSFAVGLPRRIRDELELGWINPGWEYDADSGTASGPAVDGFRLRLDAAGQLRLPDRLKLEAKLDSQTVFSDKAQVEARSDIDLSAVPYLGLPEVITPGETVVLTMPQDIGAVLHLDYGGDLGVYALRVVPATSPDLPEEFPGAGRVPLAGVVPYGDRPGLIQVSAVDGWGETLFVYEWDPVVAQAGLGGSPPLITGASELNFAGQQLCVCGSFADPAPLSSLQIGGRPLGPPSGFSPSVALFKSPGDLAPGPYEVGWQPGAAGAGGPFQTEVIEIHAKVNDKVIQKGGTTDLEMEIVGTDRQLPVALENRSPEKIEMRPSDSIETETTGGPGRNHVRGVTVSGRRQGTYSIDWAVGTGECPCAETLPEIEHAWMEVADEMVAQLAAEHQRPGVIVDSDAQGGGCDSPQLGDRFGLEVTRPEAGVPGDCRWLAPDSLLFSWTGSTGADMLVKLLDNCDFNDHFWVFAAVATDVEYTLTVTDTVHGESRTYSNPLGQAAPAIVDTTAFATCP